MGRGKPAFGTTKKLKVKTINEQDKKDLRVLADDFGLLGRQDVQEKQKNRNSAYRYVI